MITRFNSKRLTLRCGSTLLIGLLLTSCTTIPSSNYQSLLISKTNGPEGLKTWSLDGLAANGSLLLKGSPVETGRTAAAADLIFKQSGPDKIVAISLQDWRCTGRYEVSVESATSKKIQETTRFQLQPQWGAPLTLAISWDRSGAMTIRLNDQESKIFKIGLPFSRFTIEPRAGGISVDSLDYKNLN